MAGCADTLPVGARSHRAHSHQVKAVGACRRACWAVRRPRSARPAGRTNAVECGGFLAQSWPSVPCARRRALNLMRMGRDRIAPWLVARGAEQGEMRSRPYGKGAAVFFVNPHEPAKLRAGGEPQVWATSSPLPSGASRIRPRAASPVVGGARAAGATGDRLMDGLSSCVVPARPLRAHRRASY
jgi:hypothetical protein